MSEPPEASPAKAEDINDLAPLLEQLITQIRAANELRLNEQRKNKDWKIALRNGLMFGLGSAIGASILVAILAWLIRPLEQINGLKQPLEHLSRNLEKH